MHIFCAIVGAGVLALPSTVAWLGEHSMRSTLRRSAAQNHCRGSATGAHFATRIVTACFSGLAWIGVRSGASLRCNQPFILLVAQGRRSPLPPLPVQAGSPAQSCSSCSTSSASSLQTCWQTVRAGRARAWGSSSRPGRSMRERGTGPACMGVSQKEDCRSRWQGRRSSPKLPRCWRAAEN